MILNALLNTSSDHREKPLEPQVCKLSGAQQGARLFCPSGVRSLVSSVCDSSLFDKVLKLGCELLCSEKKGVQDAMFKAQYESGALNACEALLPEP